MEIQNDLQASVEAVSGVPGVRQALYCRALRKRYEDVVAVNGLDLDVYRGECFGLLGPNGAGKTTSIEILEGLTTPDSGTVVVLGQKFSQDSHVLRGKLGIQLQETRLADRLCVDEVLRLFRSFYPKGRDPEAVLSLLGLEEKRHARVHKLSGGQRQRLALACALVSEPEILFLDEPTTGLDPQARQHIWQVVDDFRRQGGTVVLTTHYMEEAAHLCDRVAIIDHGSLIACDTPAALIARLGADQIVELETKPILDVDSVRSIEGVSDVVLRAQRCVVHVDDVATALPALFALVAQRGLELGHVTVHQPTLEDVFIHLTGKALRDG